MMRKLKVGKAFMRRVIGVVGMGFALISTSAVSAGIDNAAVLAANAAFYVALNKIFVGDVGPMKTVWSNAADVTYMGPTGNFDRGWRAVLKNWEGQAALNRAH